MFCKKHYTEGVVPASGRGGLARRGLQGQGDSRFSFSSAFLLIYLFRVSAPVPRLHSDHLFVFATTFIPFQPYLHSPHLILLVTRNRVPVEARLPERILPPAAAYPRPDHNAGGNKSPTIMKKMLPWPTQSVSD